jgi:2Fe-2S ferredoxin
MEGAVNNGVEGIDADCGGACSCATCRVELDPTWQDVVPPPSEDEAEMLGLVVDRRASSRLSCQIKMRDILDGLVVHIPASQTGASTDALAPSESEPQEAR